ncbi:nacht domain protein [Fusarium flagelliforme]|uniref:Nacht domain protein n=1 Tax=Fusarium flagelliforme TaxID=2675880 RepID=A0A395MKF9_9HYPO|nr:nacht domain protein [Fusarium flagelliforme]
MHFFKPQTIAIALVALRCLVSEEWQGFIEDDDITKLPPRCPGLQPGVIGGIASDAELDSICQGAIDNPCEDGNILLGDHGPGAIQFAPNKSIDCEKLSGPKDMEECREKCLNCQTKAGGMVDKQVTLCSMKHEGERVANIAYLAEFNSIQSVPDTDAVLVFTAELDLRRQSQKGKSIASRLFPVLRAVHSFIGVIDTYVSSNPTIAALVWGSVKMTIQIMLNAASYYEAFAELFMNLSTVCPRFEQYQALFPTSTRLQVALCNFNASIIRCCERVIQMPKSSSGWASPLNPLSPSFWQSFQQSFESNLQELRDYSKNVKDEIRFAQAESEHRNRELQRLEIGEAEKSRRSLNRFMTRTRTQFDTMHQSQLVRDEELEREKKQKLLDSLSSHDYMKSFKQARQKRYPQSASWIFDTNEFENWAEGKTSPLLWCSGKMGSGKTILAASVIDFLLTKRSRTKGTVMFFFPRFDYPESLRAETTLRAVVRQIIDIQDILGDTRVALEDIQSTDEDVLTKLTQLLGLLLVRKRQPAWIVIDGMDEWPRDERQKLIEAFSALLAAGLEVKLFATSRDYPDSTTENAFPSLHQLSMNCSKAQEGMGQLVDQAVQKCLDAEELLVNDRKLVDDIKRTLTDNANGMILWVTLVLRDLCVQPNNEKIREAISLKNLPKSLTDVFNRALEQIVSQGKEEITQAILPWIVAAKQPLSLSQLEECCLIRVLQEYSIKDRYVNGIHLVDSWFHGLVEVDHETKTVHFVHSSVHMFFLTATAGSSLKGFYVNMEEADRHIGQVIVTYLNFNDFKKTVAQRRPALPPISPQDICQQALSNEFGWRKFLLRGRGERTADIDGTVALCTQHAFETLQETMDMKYPFLIYASTHWLSHSSTFNQKNCLVWQTWKTMVVNGHQLTTSPVSEGYHQTMDETLTRWATSNRHFSLLYVMATSKHVLNHSHKAMFKFVVDENDLELLLLMVKTKTWGFELSPPFCGAARSGLVDVLKVLAEAGADLNGGIDFVHLNGGIDVPTSRPLIDAIEAGQVEAIDLLLKEGANPNLPTYVYRNALEPAVDLGGSKGIKVCKMLIKAGVDLKNEHLEPPCFAVLNWARRTKTGADPKDTEIRSLTALERACGTGQEEIVELLLTAGADPNFAHFLDSPLVMSIEKEHIQIMKLLLAFGADVNVNKWGEAWPLGRACYLKNPRLDIIELLFRAGAEMDRETGYELLKKAVERNSAEFVKLLLKEGATLNGRHGSDDHTLVAIAARGGRFDIVDILIDAGAQVAFLHTALLGIY